MCSNPTRTATFSPARQASSLRQPKTKGRSLRYRNGLLTITTTNRGKATRETY